MSTALVTGSAGFIGRHFAQHLQGLGWDVIGVDLRPTCIEGVTSATTDLRRWLQASRIEPDLIIHCAAVVGGRTMIDGSPAQLAIEDVSLDGEMFRWYLHLKNPPPFVYFSSSAAYPVWLQDRHAARAERQLNERDINLDRPENPDQTYGWVKLTGERITGELQASGLPIHVFRPFSGYGEDQDLAYPFPAFIDRARRRVPIFEVWGDGTQVRDFIHVTDVVQAVMERLASPLTRPMNLCTGRGVSFLDLAAMVTEAAGYHPDIQTVPSAPTGVQYRVGSPARMRSTWTASIDIETGIRLALDG